MEKSLLLTGPDFKLYLLAEYGESSNSYLIQGKEGAYIIDPSHDPTELTPAEAAQVRYLFATHGHYDHVKACDLWRSEYPEVKFMVQEKESEHFRRSTTNVSWLFGHDCNYQAADSVFAADAEIHLEGNLLLHAYHTPGHTPGSTCYLLSSGATAYALFTGDTLFKGTVGRVDFPGGNAQAMAATLAFFNKLYQERMLAPDLVIYPGHGQSSTLEFECRHNVFLTGLIKP